MHLGTPWHKQDCEYCPPKTNGQSHILLRQDDLFILIHNLYKTSPKLPEKLHQPLRYCGLTSVSLSKIMPQTQSRTMMTETSCLSLYVMCVEFGYYYVFTMSKSKPHDSLLQTFHHHVCSSSHIATHVSNIILLLSVL